MTVKEASAEYEEYVCLECHHLMSLHTTDGCAGSTAEHRPCTCGHDYQGQEFQRMIFEIKEASIQIEIDFPSDLLKGTAEEFIRHLRELAGAADDPRSGVKSWSGMRVLSVPGNVPSSGIVFEHRLSEDDALEILLYFRSVWGEEFGR